MEYKNITVSLNPEVALIENDDIRNVVKNLLNKVPEYFWHVAASSSGKYHPVYALGEGGLVRHTKAAVMYAKDLAVIWNITGKKLDYCIAALLLHDTQKRGREVNKDHTVFEHPLLAAEFVRENAPSWFSDVVCPLVASHMGQWNTSKYAEGIILPKPRKKLEKFVHECDYLASRKNYNIEF